MIVVKFKKYHSLFLGFFLFVYFFIYDYFNKYAIYLKKIQFYFNQYHYLKKGILFIVIYIIIIIVVHSILMKVYLNNKI